MKNLFLCLLIASGLFASEINIDGAYSGLLGNPFQSKLGVKTQDISIFSESKVIPVEVLTNRNDFGSVYRKPEFTVNAGACKNVLKTFFAENYNVTANSQNTASCEIQKVTVNISYVMEKEQWMEQISNIEVETTVKLNLVLNGTVQTLVLKDKMDKSLGKDGTSYGLSIRSVWKPDTSSVDENVKKIMEHSMYRMLLTKDKK